MCYAWQQEKQFETPLPHNAQWTDGEHSCTQNTLRIPPVCKWGLEFVYFQNRTTARSL